MAPASFQTLRALKLLNIAAVGLALAAVVSAVSMQFDPHNAGVVSLVTGVPTALIGMFWAWVLRLPHTVGKSTFRWGWAASMPLAILNASVACGLLFAIQEWQPGGPAVRLLLGGLLGATFGAVAWMPALIATLVCFGLPIASAQRSAAKGLAGEERGERTVGAACAGMSVVAIVILMVTSDPTGSAHHGGLWLTRLFALGGALAGGAALQLAIARGARRRAFVADAEAGKVAGYRVDDTDEGKVLVRVVSMGEGYRVADFDEPLFDLDEQGDATRPRHLEGARVPGPGTARPL